MNFIRNDFFSKDSQVVNNLLNGQMSDQPQTEQPIIINPPNITTPLLRPDHVTGLSMSVTQTKKRLSVSPIISTFSFYNKLSVNSPLAVQPGTIVSSNTTTTVTTTTTTNSNTNLISAHQHYFQRNFSPMAALSRSPSCSTSPSVISNSTVRRPTGLTTSSLAVNLQLGSATIRAQNPNNLQVNHGTPFATPMIEPNSNPNQFKTPLNTAYATPMNMNYRRALTPLSTTIANNTIMQAETPAFEVTCEQMQPEYCFEFLWTEPMVVAGDSTFNERATKFFSIVDLYNQKYVCYLMPSKSQLRCLKLEISPDTGLVSSVGCINYIPAKDAVFVESRSLMVIIDNQGSLIVYSGLAKLCKLQLHNIIWSTIITNKKEHFQSPVITPIKSKLFQASLTKSIPNDEETTQPNVFKTPKQSNASLFYKSILASNTTQAPPQLPPPLLQQQHEFRAVNDATGSRFTVKLNDSRLVRVHLIEPATCKLVNMCLEAFKYALNRDTYYDFVQQWYIHRYSVSGDQSIRDQLHLFLYLVLSLCGCFDMGRLEQDLPFLVVSGRGLSKEGSSVAKKLEEFSECCIDSSASKANLDTSIPYLADNSLNITKRVKSNYEGSDNDFEFLLNDEIINKNQSEFNSFELKAMIKQDRGKIIEPSSDIKVNSDTDVNLRSTTGFSQRLKRSIGATGSPIPNQTPTPTSGTSTSGGILFPYLKHILYIFHIVYEESKLYKSLQSTCNSLIQVIYLISNELNLPLYMNYYESEFPFLLKLKSQKVFGNTNGLANNFTSSSSSHSIKGSSISNMITQEPPVLHQFLLKLIKEPIVDKTFINPFPIVTTVSKRTIKTIKTYALIALCTKPNLKNTSFNDFINQLFFKINFSGLSELKETGHNLSPFSLSFNFKPGEKFIYENIFSLCLEMGVSTLHELYDYPFGVLFPILEAIHWSRENPCLSWPSYVFDLIGRDDLAVLKIDNEVETKLGEGSEESAAIQLTRLEYTHLPSKRSEDIENNLTLKVQQNTKKEDEDGMQHVMQLETLKCRFGEDLRVKEVRACLQATRPVLIKLTQGPDVSDHDFVEEEEKFLACICIRTMALSVGRGMFTLHTISPIPTEPVSLPELNLKGKSVTKKTTIDLTRIEVPTNMSYWPFFHNGVAAGLTIHAHAEDLSSAWIKSHLAKNFELTNEQAGFLFGLGLTGHLANLSILNVHDALARRHDLTNIAILLGLSASK